MGKHTSKVTALEAAVLAFALVLLPPSLAWAAGLGKLTVLSALGQPLRAEIEISSLKAGEADSVTAQLAGPETYREAGVNLSAAATEVRFAIDRRANGRYVVMLTSKQPINEPFLDLLVELNWSSGRLVREYTFLLDPPGYKPPGVATSAPAVSKPVVEVHVPAQAQASQAAPPVVEKKLETAQPAAAAEAAVTYKVKRGDTLTRIAIRHKQEGISLQQMLVALYRGNRDAFDGNNMNRMRAGKILNIPNRKTAARVSQGEAQRIVVAQNSEYEAYRRQIGVAVAQAPAQAEGGRQASGRISVPRQTKRVPPARGMGDHLSLSKAGETTAPGKLGAEARGDDLVAKEKELADAKARIAMLEKTVRELQQLVKLKSETGAQMQQAAKGGQAEVPSHPKVQPGAAATAAATTPTEVAKAGAASEGAKENAPHETPAKAVEKPKPPKPVRPAKPARPKAAPKPPPPQPEPSFLDELMGNPGALGGAAGVVILLALYAVYAWRQKRKAQVASGLAGAGAGLELPPAFGPVDEQQAGAAAAAIAEDFGREDIGKAEAEEIDPVAEADVYMAYGRDVQAEEILKEALAKDPSRQAIREKLLEIYANRKDLKAFEATATELHAATGGQGPEWDKAATLGRSIDAQNPLYQGAASGAPVEPTDTVAMPQVDLAAQALAAVDTPAADTPAVDTPAEEVTQEGVAALDFDLDLGGAPGEPAVQQEAAPEAKADVEEASPSTLDFDLDLGGETAGEIAAQPAGEEAQKPEAEAAAVDEGTTIDFDLGPMGEEVAAEQPAEQVAVPAAEIVTAPVEEAVAPEAAEEAGVTMDFDLGTPDEAPEAAQPETPQPEPVASEDAAATMDFDLSLPEDSEVGEAPADGAAAAEEAGLELNLSSIDLSLDSASADAPKDDTPAEAPKDSAPDAHWQEVATKLDLAKAYEEMGDKDGARELLNEVAAEGDTAQKQQAQTMLAALG